MAVSQDNPRAHNLEPHELREQLVGLKGSTKKVKPSPKFHWLGYLIPIVVFVFSKIITNFLQMTSESKDIIDIVLVILIVSSIAVYTSLIYGDKNG